MPRRRFFIHLDLEEIFQSADQNGGEYGYAH